jgi:hypothetical protein
MIRKATLTTALSAALLLFVGAAPAAAVPPRLKFGWTDCAVTYFPDVGSVGFATDFPTAYAANATPGRDKQYAYLYTQFYQWAPDGSGWVLGPTTTYRALTSDNNYAIVWTDMSNGRALHFPYERQQFVIQTTGIYRVRQKLVWKRNGRVPGYYTNWRWLRHTGPGSESDGTSSFCYVR